MERQFPFDDLAVTLKDGRRVRLRSACAEDAAAFRAYLLRALPGTDGVATYTDEIGSVEDCRRRLVDDDPARQGLSLVAEPADGPGVIVGDCRLKAFNRRKLDGVVTVGMMCDHGWRGVGLGRAMLAAAVDWARASPGVRRVELGVMATNPSALALYRSLGFVEEGRFRGRFRQGDGSLVDDLAMVLEVGDGRLGV
jgi:RimJ/RimL family protein N-acetyltransferase